MYDIIFEAILFDWVFLVESPPITRGIHHQLYRGTLYHTLDFIESVVYFKVLRCLNVAQANHSDTC